MTVQGFINSCRQENFNCNPVWWYFEVR